MLLRSILLTLSLLVLIGCKGFLQNNISSTSTVDSTQLAAFESELQKNYLELAQNELNEDDLSDTSYFLNRSRTLLAGGNVVPTELSYRHIAEPNEELAASHRQSLVNFLDSGARVNDPEVAARAQTMFDCWLQEIEENRQPDDISACEQAFLTAIATAASDTPEPFVANTSEAGENYNAFFDFNISKPSTNDQALKEFIEKIKRSNPTFVVITANSDSVGSAEYNQQLSKKRGEYVRDMMIGEGFDFNLIKIVPLGERSLPVLTSDGVQEAGNRRANVEIRY